MNKEAKDKVKKYAFGGRYDSDPKPKRKPIYTSNPKDPRLQAYNDSLRVKSTVDQWNRVVHNAKNYDEVESFFNSPKHQADMELMKNYKIDNDGGVKNFSNGAATYSSFPSPVQPIVYQKPQRPKGALTNPYLSTPSVDNIEDRPIPHDIDTTRKNYDTTKPTNYSFTYPTFDHIDSQNTIYFPDEDMLKDFVKDNKLVSMKSTKSGTTASGYRTKYATGGESGTTKGFDLSSLLGMIPQLTNSVDSLTRINPNDYSNQPILNASTMRNMVSPYSSTPMYAMGGEDGEDQLDQLQEIADNNGMTLEELIQQLGQQDQNGDVNIDDSNNNSDSSDDGDGSYAMGGHWIQGAVNPKHKGYCTPMSKSTCTGHRKTLAKLFKKKHGFHKKAMGGYSNDNINVEGGEVLESPTGKLAKVRGPKHEQGGVDVNVPDGTKIFSDRLKIGGKSMQQRKLARTSTMARLAKLVNKNPTDQLLKSTLKRTALNHNNEDQNDMALQKVANRIYQSPKYGMGGRVKEKKYAFGGDDIDYIDPENVPPFFDKTGWHMTNAISTGRQVDLRNSLNDPINFPILNNSETNLIPINPSMILRGVPPGKPRYAATKDQGFTTGDYVGLAGSIFNSVAPIINTNNAARATRPNINRFRGFGKRALEDNSQAENYIAGVRSNELTDIDTSANSSLLRNRNSARGINTLRALDLATDMGRDKARSSTNNSTASEMVGILGQRSSLDNQKDQYEMSGETSRDLEEKGDIDNYYSNMAANLTNLGTNVQGIGRSLNQSKSNKVNSKLISQLSRYGLGFDEDGNLITTRR